MTRFQKQMVMYARQEGGKESNNSVHEGSEIIPWLNNMKQPMNRPKILQPGGKILLTVCLLRTRLGIEANKNYLSWQG